MISFARSNETAGRISEVKFAPRSPRCVLCRTNTAHQQPQRTRYAALHANLSPHDEIEPTGDFHERTAIAGETAELRFANPPYGLRATSCSNRRRSIVDHWSSPKAAVILLPGGQQGEAQVPCYVMLEFTAKPGTGPAALEALRAALPDTRNKDGCENLDVTVNQDDLDNVLLVMRWTSRKHYQTYRDWREANGDVQRFAKEATVNGLSTRFFDVTDV